MATLIELRQQYGTLMTQANEVATKGFTTESRSQFDRMIADADAIYADIQRAEKLEKFAVEQRATQAPPRAGFETRTDADKEHEKRAFFQWMRTGSSVGYEQRDLGVGTPSAPITGGNVLVPSTVGPLVDAKKSYGNLLDYVSVIRTSDGHQISIPLANDTGNGLILVSQAVSNSTEVDPTLSSVPSNVDTATSGVVKISNELLMDAYFNLEDWINQKLNTRWARGFSQWISQGNSSNVAALAFNSGVTSAASGAVAYPDLAGLYGSLDASYAVSGEWVMSSTTRASLMGLVSSTGQPILQQNPVNGDPFGAIFGRPIVIDPFRPAIAAGNVPILFGDLSEAYTARTAGDFVIKRLNELFALSNETAFVLYTRVSGVNTDAGTHPVKALTVHA